MSADNTTLPLSIALLITGFFAYTLTEQEHHELDEWVCASDDNQRIFEAFVEMNHRATRPGPDDDTDEPDPKYVVRLIMKLIDKTITAEEQQSLDNWADESELNKKLLKELPQTGNMEQVYYWLLKRVSNDEQQKRLN